MRCKVGLVWLGCEAKMDKISITDRGLGSEAISWHPLHTLLTPNLLDLILIENWPAPDNRVLTKGCQLFSLLAWHHYSPCHGHIHWICVKFITFDRAHTAATACQYAVVTVFSKSTMNVLPAMLTEDNRADRGLQDVGQFMSPIVDICKRQSQAWCYVCVPCILNWVSNRPASYLWTSRQVWRAIYHNSPIHHSLGSGDCLVQHNIGEGHESWPWWHSDMFYSDTTKVMSTCNYYYYIR